MSKIMHRFLIFAVSAALVACGSKALRVRDGQARSALSPLLLEQERQRVLPHLGYSWDIHTIDRARGTIELSFCFVKEQGDSLLWVECVEQVPMAIVDTALCRRWFDYDYIR